jgi:hypothetical protein
LVYLLAGGCFFADPRNEPAVEQAGTGTMSDPITAENCCRGILTGLAANDRICGPILMAVRQAESLAGGNGFNSAEIVNRYLVW